MFSSRHTPSGNDKNRPIPESHRSALLRDAARRRIGQLLRAAGRISQDELDQALAIQKKQGGEIIDVLFSMGCLQPNELLDFLLTLPGLGPADFCHLDIGPELIGLISGETARAYQVIPIDRYGRTVVLGCATVPDDAEREKLEETVGAHVQLLRCAPEDVEAAIARYYPEEVPGGEFAAASTRTLEGLGAPLRLSRVARLVRRLTSLPALPETLNQVRAAVESPDSSVRSVADIIALDPPIAAKILSVANSAFYGFAQPIHDLVHAISLMGLRETYGIVLSTTVIDLVSKWKNLEYRTFWLESMCCAAAARIVARASGRRGLPGIFAAGLLHDLGRAALLETVPDACAKIDGGLTGHELLDAEERLVGLSHTEAGYELARQWGLPPEITAPIRFHHDPMRATEAREHVAIVSLADAMVYAATDNYAENLHIFDDHQETLAFLGIDPEVTEAMLAEYLSRRQAAFEETSENL
ncbi:MAG TPA: HDOD domain-containing protein [Candidatus Hydrogenedentes bacterium]|nr:HDOD domain-containing protein [Candidatus Hydrogenedentota bacterium]HPV38561.1 HDOD domain-containing protein [Candidatus Hydrogenedentota bacterium]